MELGFDEAGSGDVLLLVHGFPLDRSMWGDQLAGLADIRRVVAVDLRGRGKSPAEGEGWTVDDYADDLAATIDGLGVSSVDVAGLSMGGYVVFAFLRRHGGKARSVILVDTKAGADTAEGKEGRTKTAALVREQGTAALVEGLFPKMFAPGVSPEVTGRMKVVFESTPGAAAGNDAIAMRERPDSTPDLGGISIPALVIHGEEDQLMPIDGAKEMAAAIPGAKFVGIPAAGHMAPVENPKAVNEAMREFLSGL
jgi:pimeloyl-ACP methyl ester carboxylesterase